MEKLSRKEKMEAITQRLEEGVREIFESGKFEEYLRVMSKFHHYSVRNSVLIALQNPDATLCSGYQAWKKNFGRYVKKGEKAIEIIAPIKYEVKVKELKDEVMIRKYADRNPEDVIQFTTFRPAYVFDVSQTDGKPLPEIAPDIAGSVTHFHEFMQAVKETSPVSIVTEPLTGSDGFYSQTEKKIHLREGMSEVQTMAAAVHEMAHATLHDLDMKDPEASAEKLGKDRATKEVEAESVAYVVNQYFGIETGENSFGYVAAWSKDKELPELMASLDTIRKTADGMITKMEASLEKQRNLYGMETPMKIPAVMEPSFYLKSEREAER